MDSSANLDTPAPRRMSAGRLEETAAFPFIEVSGSARNIGLQYGRKAAGRIHRSIEIYRRLFAEKDVDWNQARTVASAVACRIASAYPRITEEMRAMAEGAGVPFEDIVAINARSELLHVSFGKPRADGNDVDGCTGAVALPTITREGHMIHAQNWDWRDECADSSVVVKIVPDVGPSMLVFGEAGVMACVGLNNAGLAVTTNHLQCDQDGKRAGLPDPIVRRQVLAQGSLGGAIETVLKAERGSSIGFLISHREGEAVGLEATPEQVFWLSPEEDLLVHANHFVSTPARVAVRDTGLLASTDSLYRDSRVRRHLTKHSGRITLSTLQAAFQDRFGAPRAVCRTPVEAPSTATVATIIMDTTAQIMWAAPRPYGPHKFTEYRLP
jgi:isopenicillin-N N-acyltransferase-like protein